jgi:YHS domain-containing protein
MCLGRASLMVDWHSPEPIGVLTMAVFWSGKRFLPSLMLALALLAGAAGVIFFRPGATQGAIPPVDTELVAGVALGGYDAVAYFSTNHPVEGNAAFTHRYKGVEWRFSSAANRDAFKADPARYAPQYGGYCAWAVAHGGTAKGDPQAWKIVNGKLYLNYDSEIQKRWEQDIPANIAKSETNWPKISIRR